MLKLPIAFSLSLILLWSCQTKQIQEASKDYIEQPEAPIIISDPVVISESVIIPEITSNPSSPVPKQITIDPNLPQATAPKIQILLDHEDFQISYNTEHNLPNWVSYHLLAKNLKTKIAKKKSQLFVDPLLFKKNLAWLLPSAYADSDYQARNLAPPADFEWSQSANDETFVMTNMVPQKPNLSEHAWKDLEDRIRRWACTEEKLEIVTGPIFDENLPKLFSGASVPRRFYKAVLDDTPPRKAIGFIYSQDDTTDVYRERAVPVREIEKIIGFDLFSQLEPQEREQIETEFNLDDWVEGQCETAD